MYTTQTSVITPPKALTNVKAVSTEKMVMASWNKRYKKCRESLEKTVVNTETHDTMKETNEKNAMVESQSLGNINVSVLEKEFGKLQTSEVIVTNERMKHIKERHPIDYELFEKYSAECVQNPNYVIKDGKSKGTVFMVKKLPDTNLNVVSRLALDTDESGLKNSVMTFYRIREPNLEKLIRKNVLLYKKE